MKTDNKMFAEAILDLKYLGGELRLRSYLTPEEIHNLSYMITNDSDEVITAHEREIAAKDAEIAELRGCLKEACDTVCSGGLVGCRGTFAYGSKCCLLAECEYHKWRKTLEGVK